ncbi:hypothetical protein [Demequina zhanjiangensis]|uniref:Leucine rich repeat variant n=1 Tax=Demequina zhanjiangensis TaxID=3051659 RepID=A0ABT8G4L3_9MICO|nr:hypothetical protein [Demequina sp. SYSU T00b26]MDN4474071.1 hypothetical protein [Demequina sp. SYSU T00b26]
MRNAMFAQAAAGDRLDPQEIAEMARSRDRAVRAAIAARPDIPMPTMLRLATDRSVEVRIALAGNRAIARSSALLDALAQDPSVEVRLALVGNSATPVHTLQALALRARGPESDAATGRLDTERAYDVSAPVVALKLASGDDARPMRLAPVRGFRVAD